MYSKIPVLFYEFQDNYQLHRNKIYKIAQSHSHTQIKLFDIMYKHCNRTIASIAVSLDIN